MKMSFLYAAALLLGSISISSYAYDTSMAVPIHRTVAKRHVAKPVKKSTSKKPVATRPADARAASSAQ